MEITDSVMTSASTFHTAWRVDEQADEWRVSWLPDRTLTRNEALSALTLAEMVLGDDPPGMREPLIQVFASELGMSPEDAVSAVEAAGARDE